MKKILLTTAIMIGVVSIMEAQELKSITYSSSEIEESKVVLSENWSSIVENNSILVYNGSIKNQSERNLKNLFVELYLIPKSSNLPAGSIQGYPVAKVPFKQLDKSGSLVGVNIKSDIKDMPPSGLYNPVLILTDKSGSILNFHKVRNTIEAKDGNLAIYRAPIEVIEDKPELNPVVKIDIREDNSVVLEKDWKVEVDFKNFMVKVIGGDISNNAGQDLNNLVLDVYLTKENQSSITGNFDGLRIASAELEKIEKHKKFVDTTITTNLAQIPQNGTYHILLTVSVKDENGNPVVRTKRAFNDPITF